MSSVAAQLSGTPVDTRRTQQHTIQYIMQVVPTPMQNCLTGCDLHAQVYGLEKLPRVQCCWGIRKRAQENNAVQGRKLQK